jgi:D-amino-acid dehydrogenase
MHVLVIGGGIIGVATAYQLNQSGHDVTLVEREADVACLTSKGNAGVIAPGYVTPWAAPGMPLKIVKYMFKSASPVIFRPQFERRQWQWVAHWLKECDLERFRVNKQRMQRIAYYSRDCLTAFREQHPFEYWRTQGYLQLFRTESDQALARPALQILAEAGINHRLIDADECARVEPALRWAAVKPVSGLYLPDDESGDCAEFARQLRTLCESKGVAFRFNSEVEHLLGSSSGVSGVRLRDAHGSTSTIDADAIVVAAGIESRELLLPFDIRVPLYPVKGYSATLAIADPDRAPRAAVMDESLKTAITRMGPNVRIAGTAELGDGSLTIREQATRTLLKVMRDWFPDAADLSQASFWAGRRPMTPDGPPLLGKTPVRGLFLNLGHGSTGWAMSMGSAKVVADLIGGREPAIDLSGLTLDRYKR